MNTLFRLAKAATLFGLIITSQAMAQVQQGTVSLTCPSKIDLAYADVTLVGDGAPIGPIRFTCGSLSENGRTDKRSVASFSEITTLVATIVVVTPNQGACPEKEVPLGQAITCKGAFEEDPSRYARNAPEVKLTTRIR